jgi:hypothetical protein
VPSSALALPNAAALLALASASPAKSVCIRQPARSYGSVIDLSAPDAAQALASRHRQSLCVLASQHAPPVLSLICPLQIRRRLWHLLPRWQRL